jgi:N-acetylglucosaminyldiphosphoundecaprenol N-acetyl-beta-D-mannosaminyltransferase
MERVSLMGLDFDPVTEQEAVATILDRSARGEGGYVVTPNLAYLREYQFTDDVCDWIDDADLVVPDGMPLLWASRLKREPLPDRVAGSNLIWSLSHAAAYRGASVFLLGGEPGTAEAAARRLTTASPDLEVRGSECPERGFENDPERVFALARRVAETSPDIVFLGLPLTKQLALARELRRQLPKAWLIGVGVSFSFVSGHIHRAPRWVQRVGLEWVHRLVQEPRRLFRRYVIDGLPFAGRLFAYAALARALSSLSRRPDLIRPRRSS